MNDNDGEYDKEVMGKAGKVEEYMVYGHNGKLHMVPKNFEFPKRVDLKTGLQFWLYGQTCLFAGKLMVQNLSKN